MQTSRVPTPVQWSDEQRARSAAVACLVLCRKRDLGCANILVFFTKKNDRSATPSACVHVDDLVQFANWHLPCLVDFKTWISDFWTFSKISAMRIKSTPAFQGCTGPLARTAALDYYARVLLVDCCLQPVSVAALLSSFYHHLAVDSPALLVALIDVGQE